MRTIVSTIIILVFILFIIYVLRQRKLLRFLVDEQKKKEAKKTLWQEKDEQQLSIIRKRIEYTALQNQINPHFLYNTLESIRSRAITDNNMEIASMTELLSKFFRYCISNGEGLIKIREEINHIRNYYAIQKYRFEERISMEILRESDELLDLYIPKMSLQPLVENAMIHGLENKAMNGQIILRLKKTEKKLVISVEDNGAGMDWEQLEQINAKMKSSFVDVSGQRGNRNGIALVNVNARIKISFGEEYGIHYRSVKGRGTQAILTMLQIDEFARVKYNDILYIEE